MGFFRKKKADPTNEPESTAKETPTPVKSTTETAAFVTSATETATADAPGCPERGGSTPDARRPTIEGQDGASDAADQVEIPSGALWAPEEVYGTLHLASTWAPRRSSSPC